MRPKTFIQKLDWPVIGIYLALVFIGCFNIFASLYDADQRSIWDIFDISQRYGLQLIWAVTAIGIAVFCLSINGKFYSVFAWPIYLISIISLISILVVGVEISGSKSWFALGNLRIQPAEFSKIACSLALARLMSAHDFKFKTFRGIVLTCALILLPPLLIVLENETGLALVYAAFFFVLYREGLSGWILVFGVFAIILFVLSILWEESQVFMLIAAVCAVGYALVSRKWIYMAGFFLLFVIGFRFVPGLFENQVVFSPAVWFLILFAPFFIIGIIYAIRARIRTLWLILLSLCTSFAIVFSVDYFFDHVLQDHQRMRILILLGVTEDPQGAGYNVHQSKVAIGSGGLLGKGFLKGTQTKDNSVP
ncbi:MAG: rod shape-determining protein RodA, partial [Bacteroidales bacterium]|nr:rod shape-determining protein RodA [Bacteroidales bacterium]